MVNSTLLYKDYDKALPKGNYFLMPKYYNYDLPKQGSAEYFQFLELLKMLEYSGRFNRNMLEQFV